MRCARLCRCWSCHFFRIVLPSTFAGRHRIGLHSCNTHIRKRSLNWFLLSCLTHWSIVFPLSCCNQAHSVDALRDQQTEIQRHTKTAKMNSLCCQWSQKVSSSCAFSFYKDGLMSGVTWQIAEIKAVSRGQSSTAIIIMTAKCKHLHLILTWQAVIAPRRCPLPTEYNVGQWVTQVAMVCWWAAGELQRASKSWKEKRPFYFGSFCGQTSHSRSLP